MLTRQQLEQVEQLQREWEAADRAIRESVGRTRWQYAARGGVEQHFYQRLAEVCEPDLTDYSPDEAGACGLNWWREIVRERYVMARDIIQKGEEL